MMSRKDYVAMADTIKSALAAVKSTEAREGVALVARDYAKHAMRDSPAFRAVNFFVACGLTSDGKLPC
jgi:hypothetical protein